MFDRAAAMLGAGHAVILDATFIDPRMRVGAEDVARRAGVQFHGFWLDAPESVLAARLRARQGDASDADVAVLHGQIVADLGVMSWCRLDASGDQDSVLAAAQDWLAAQ
jgi:predicted kinase